jgi:hypothetical protein
MYYKTGQFYLLLTDEAVRLDKRLPKIYHEHHRGDPAASCIGKTLGSLSHPVGRGGMLGRVDANRPDTDRIYSSAGSGGRLMPTLGDGCSKGNEAAL